MGHEIVYTNDTIMSLSLSLRAMEENISYPYDGYDDNSTGDAKLDKIISANVIYGQQGAAVYHPIFHHSTYVFILFVPCCVLTVL